jgi:hypothetical protein
MTLYCYDTEFIENGKTIDLISIGIVCEDGREYYAVNADMPQDRICKHDWLMEHVVPSLPGTGRPYRLDGHGAWIWVLNTRDTAVKPKWVIANEVRDFLLAGDDPQLWAYYGAYDHVALAQLWGTMMALPTGIPMFTHELMQLLEQVQADGVNIWVGKGSAAAGEHNALADARWNMDLYRICQEARV